LFSNLQICNIGLTFAKTTRRGYLLQYRKYAAVLPNISIECRIYLLFIQHAFLISKQPEENGRYACFPNPQTPVLASLYALPLLTALPPQICRDLSAITSLIARVSKRSQDPSTNQAKALIGLSTITHPLDHPFQNQVRKGNVRPRRALRRRMRVQIQEPKLRK
jgi:hypothetical protein